MKSTLCASCRRSTVDRFAQVRPYGISVDLGEGRRLPLVALCRDCADPARFSSDQLADAIIAEFARQLSPKKAAS